MVLIGYRGNPVQKGDLRTELKERQVRERVLAPHRTHNKCVIDCLQMSSLHIKPFGTFAKFKSQGISKKR